jgi:hypothetical protein
MRRSEAGTMTEPSGINVETVSERVRRERTAASELPRTRGMLGAVLRFVVALFT